MTTDVYKANLKIGDTILLCTDGLTTGLSDERIKQMLHPNQRGRADMPRPGGCRQ